MGIDVTSDEPGESMDGADIIGDMDVIAGGIIDGIDIIEEEPEKGMAMVIDNIARPSSGSTDIEVLLRFGPGAPARGPVLVSCDRTVVPPSNDRQAGILDPFAPLQAGSEGLISLPPNPPCEEHPPKPSQIWG